MQQCSVGQQKPTVKPADVTHPVGPAVNDLPPQLQAAVAIAAVPHVVPMEGNSLNIGGVVLNPENIAREQFRVVVARHFLRQAIDANANAAEQKTFPFKRFVQFAFKFQLTLEGWFVDICPTFPGDLGFDVDKIQHHQWHKIWDAVFEDQTLKVHRWTTGSSFVTLPITSANSWHIQQRNGKGKTRIALGWSSMTRVLFCFSLGI